MKTYRAALLGLTAGAAIMLAAPAANADGMRRGSIKDSGCCYNWSGIYVGLSAGWQWTDIDGEYVAVAGRYNVEHDSSIFGAIVGVQHQWGNIVLGLEAHWSGSMQDQKWGLSFGDSPDCLVDNRTCSGRMNSLFTFGPRLGWAAGNALFYATAGYAQASIETRTVISSTDLVTSRTKHPHEGWFVGGGLDWAVSKNVIIGVEYQHVFLDSELHLAFDGAQVATPVNNRVMEADSDIFRARVTFKLDKDCCARPLK